MPLFTPQIETGATQGVQAEGAKPPSVASTVAPAIGKAASDLITFFGNQEIIDTKKKASAEKTNALSGYTKTLVELSNMARTSPNVSTAALRIKADKATMDLLNTNPALYKEAIEIRKSITTQAGLGKTLAQGTEEEQAEVRVTNAARDAGLVLEGMTPEQAEAGKLDYLRIVRSTKELEALSKRSDYDEKQKKIKSQESLVEFNRATTADFSRKVDLITQNFERGLIDEKEAKAQIDQLKEIREATARDIGAHAGADFMSNQMHALNSIYTNATSYLSGDFELKALQNKNKMLVARQESDLLRDTETAKVVALSSLFGHANSQLMNRASSNLITRHLGDISLEDRDLPNPFGSNQEEKKVAYEVVLENISEFNSSTRPFTPEEIEGLDTSLNRLLQGIDINQLAVKSPKDLKPIVTFLSNPKVGQYIQSSGGMLPDTLNAANLVVGSKYIDKIIPKIRQQYEQANISVLSATGRGLETGPSTSNVIDIKPSNGTVRFVVNEEAVSKLGPAGRGIALAQASDLNSLVSPMLNEMVRLGAHMEGNTNYSKFLNDNIESIFGKRETEQEALTPESLNQQAQSQGVDLSQFADGQYEDSNGNLVTIKGGKIVEVGSGGPE